MDNIFDYLMKISPSGFSGDFMCIDWKVIRLLTEHWLSTKQDHYPDYTSIMCVIKQCDLKRIYMPNEYLPTLQNLYQGKYVFRIEDLPLSSEEEIILNRLFSKYISQAKSSKRRNIRTFEVGNIKTVRQNVFARDNYKCKYCGSKEKLTVDHIKPVNHGGKNEYENFQTLCNRCNSSKSDRLLKNDC